MSQKLSDAVTIRDYTQEDLPFILDGWIRTWRISDWAGTVPNNMIWEVTRSVIAGLLTRGARILVAEVDRESGGKRLVGFICLELPHYLHFLFVKRAFRGLGVAALLLDSWRTVTGCQVGTFTHRTLACRWLADNGWTWDPVPARKEAL